MKACKLPLIVNLKIFAQREWSDLTDMCTKVICQGLAMSIATTAGIA